MEVVPGAAVPALSEKDRPHDERQSRGQRQAADQGGLAQNLARMLGSSQAIQIELGQHKRGTA